MREAFPEGDSVAEADVEGGLGSFCCGVNFGCLSTCAGGCENGKRGARLHVAAMLHGTNSVPGRMHVF